MSITQNEKISQVKDTTLVVGIDVSSETYYARAFDWRGLELAKVFKFESASYGFGNFSEWLSELCKTNQKDNIIIGAEPTGHYWFTLAEYLKENGIKFVFVNPMHVKRTKELDDNHPSKNDRKDPKVIAKLVIEGRYLIPYIPEDIYAELRVMNESRMRINKELVAIKNRIQRWFAIYFPEYKNVFGNWECDSSIEVLLNIPLPADAVNMGADAINQLWRAKKIRAVGIKRAKLLVEVAANSIGVKQGVNAARCEISMLIEDFLKKKEQEQRVIEILETLCIQVPNADKLLNIKGVGILTVASFFGEVGDIRRFDSPKQIQKLAGLAITENSSGKYKGQSCISKRGRKLLRYTLFQAVMSMIMHLPEFKELHRYYTTRTKNPLKGKQSKVALCCKVIRIFYVLLNKGVEYDSQKLMKDIVRPEVIAA